MRSRVGFVRGERGAVLAFVMMMIGILSVVAFGLSRLARLDLTQQTLQETLSRNFYVTEAGVNRGIAEFGNIFRGFNVPTGTDFDPRTFTLNHRTIRYQLQEVPPNPRQITMPPGDLFAGLNTIQYRYVVSSQELGLLGTPEIDLGAEFDVNNIPLFQFAAFYTDDLEILPGPDMFLHGRVHTNANLYLNADNSLRIEDSPPAMRTVQVSSGGTVIRGRKDQPGSCSGVVIIDKLEDADNDGNLDPLEVPCGGAGGMTEAQALAWKGSVRIHVGSINPPGPDEIVRGNGTFWANADLRIVLDLDGTPVRLDPVNFPTAPLLIPIVVQNADGSTNTTSTQRLRSFMLTNPGKIFYNDVPNCPTPDGACAATATKYNPPFLANSHVYRRADDAGRAAEWTLNPADARRGGFFNNREKSGGTAGRWMRLLNVDVQALLAWNRSRPASQQLFNPNDTSGGGIVLFLSVKGPLSVAGPSNPGGINNYGVRVFDSADLGFPTGLPDPTGITVVSDQAIYVQGDYNRINKTPAALIGDSLNVISQAWESTGSNDLKTTDHLANRRAAQTTVNAAFLAGVDTTAVGNYNGGLENYPRFHEDWSGGIPFHYRGSFVSLGTPRHVNGPWCGTGGSKTSGCNIYNPPVRNWDYDSAFDDAANLPPLTPKIVWVQQVLYTQQFR